MNHVVRPGADDRVEAARERARWQAAALEAELDDLTGAHQRESGMSVMQLELDYARRSNWPFVLALVEIDGRGRTGDGDEGADGGATLQALVRTTWSNLGPYDPVVRWGPAGFLCGLVGSSVEEAEHRFATVVQVLRDAVGTGISVGLAPLVAGETLPELLARVRSRSRQPGMRAPAGERVAAALRFPARQPSRCSPPNRPCHQRRRSERVSRRRSGTATLVVLARPEGFGRATTLAKPQEGSPSTGGAGAIHILALRPNHRSRTAVVLPTP
jgi:GGDEF domain-containing protein